MQGVIDYPESREPTEAAGLFAQVSMLHVYFECIDGKMPVLGLMALDTNGEIVLEELQRILTEQQVAHKSYRRSRHHGGKTDGMRIVCLPERRKTRRKD